VECEEEEISTEEVHNICIIFDIAIDKNKTYCYFCQLSLYLKLFADDTYQQNSSEINTVNLFFIIGEYNCCAVLFV